MTPHRFRQVAARAALISGLAVGAIACGDDDDDAGTDVETETPAGDTGGDTGGTDEQAAGNEDGCAALVEFNDIASNLDTEEASPDDLTAAGEELQALWAEVLAVAPDEVADDATSIQGVLDDLVAGDAEAFSADATFETYSTVMSATVAECDFETISATAVDYAFEGVPETVSAGTVALELTNDSEMEVHEMVIFKKAEGETRSAEEILADPASQEEGPGEFAGAVFAEPGATGSGLAQLTPGEYIAVCFVPTGGDEEADPHFMHGMFAELTVE